MEVDKVVETNQGQMVTKIEMDRSFQQGNNSGESGVFSNNSATSIDSSWEHFEDEIVDPEVFDPPILQSSNLCTKRVEYSLSTIEGDLANSSVGKTSITLMKTCIEHYSAT